MEQKVDVSIIIPVKNEEYNITRCLKSITALDYQAGQIEIIIVDNGSTDKTVEIANRFGVKVYIDENATIAGLRNLGVKQSLGEFIGFIDADIAVHPSWLTNGLRHFKNPQIACVGSSPEIPKKNTWVERTKYLQVKAQPEVWDAQWICSMNMIIRKTVFNNIGGFDSRLVTCEDVDIGYRIGKLKDCNKIVRDKKIRAVHYGEAKTVWHFFQKERWRATSNFAGIRCHGIIFHEIPSILIPIVNSLSLIVFVLLLSVAKFETAYIFFLIILVVPLLKSLNIALKTNSIPEYPKIYIIQTIYMFSRIIATYDYAWGTLRIFFKRIKSRPR